MKIIDKKGKLFGKVSIIDVLTVLVILAMVSWFVWARIGRNLQSEVASREQPIEFTVVINAIRKTTAEAIEKGDRMFEFKTGAFVGTVESVSTEPADVLLAKEGGVMLRVEDSKRVDTFVTITSTARVSEDVITVNGVEIRVGATIGLKSKYVQVQGNVMIMSLPEGDPGD